MNNWQDMLWAIPNSCGRWWDIVVGVIALATALTMFIKLIMNHTFDILLFARGMVSIGLLGVALIPVNSGWQKIAIAEMVLGLALSTGLIVTDWCHRPDKNVTIPQAVAAVCWRAISRVAHRAYSIHWPPLL